MRTLIALSVVWTLLSAALGSLWAPRPRQRIQRLDIATPERIAEATEFVNKKYQEEADRLAQELSKSKNMTHPRNESEKWMVKCKDDKDYFDKKPYDIGLTMFKEWCDSDDGYAAPFTHYWLDFGNTRIALCNWGFYNPCQSAEVDDGFAKIEDSCPDTGSGDDAKVSTGLWYESSWRKGYWRSNCTTLNICDGADRHRICRNEG
ncbi:hypothetical protein PG999_014397 [Apiospora kogelbergensis]|uniref:Uncharacterized protein n=1 Tax=Apiospora kogelbergensis TaxID=1337665 RepID=A0AAW0Q5R6_9PEZI